MTTTRTCKNRILHRFSCENIIFNKYRINGLWPQRTLSIYRNDADTYKRSLMMEVFVSKEIILKPGDNIHKITKEKINDFTERYSCQQYLCLKIEEKNKDKHKAILTKCGFTPECWDNIYNYDDLINTYDLQIVETSFSSAESASENKHCLRWLWDDGFADIPQDQYKYLCSRKIIIKHYQERKEHYDAMIDLHPGDFLKKACKRKAEIPDSVKPLILRDATEQDFTEFDEFTFIVLAVTYDNGWPIVTVAPIIHYVEYWETCYDYDDALQSNTIEIHPEAKCYAVQREYKDRQPTERRFIKIAYLWKWNDGDVLLPYNDWDYPNPRNRNIADITVHMDLIDDYNFGNKNEDFYISGADYNCSARKDYLNNIHIL